MPACVLVHSASTEVKRWCGFYTDELRGSVFAPPTTAVFQRTGQDTDTGRPHSGRVDTCTNTIRMCQRDKDNKGLADTFDSDRNHCETTTHLHFVAISLESPRKGGEHATEQRGNKRQDALRFPDWSCRLVQSRRIATDGPLSQTGTKGECLRDDTHARSFIAYFFDRTLVPSARSILLMIWLFGSALPDSYWLITAGFSLMACASCACDHFFSMRAFWMLLDSDRLTVGCASTSVSASSLERLVSPVRELEPAPSAKHRDQEQGTNIRTRTTDIDIEKR